jgi:hypothetical protein
MLLLLLRFILLLLTAAACLLCHTQDNGSGMAHADIPNMLGRVLSGTKYGVKQTRGERHGSAGGQAVQPNLGKFGGQDMPTAAQTEPHCVARSVVWTTQLWWQPTETQSFSQLLVLQSVVRSVGPWVFRAGDY